MEEIWSYQFARRIANNQVPYRDFFMIVSPFKAQIDMILLKLFSDQLIVLRWFALATAFINGIFLFQISIKLGLSKLNSLLPVFLFFFSFAFFPINNYNWFSLLIITLLLFFFCSTQNKWNAFLIGLLSALLILTKQSIGFYMVVGIVSYFWLIRYKFSLFSLIGLFVVFIPEIVYFWIKGALRDFLEIFYINWIPFYEEYFQYNSNKLLFSIFLIILFVILLYLLIKKIRIIPSKANSIHLIIIIIINLVVLGYSFPIFDFVHIFLLLPYFSLLVLNFWKVETRTFLYLIAFIIFIQGYYGYFSTQNSFTTDILHLKGIRIDRELQKDIISVSNFQKDQILLGNHTYEIDYRNVLLDIAMDRLGYKYDCMLKGNFGRNGEDEMVSMIIKDQKAIVIFHKKYSNSKQQTKITEFVEKNLIFKETIGSNYLVYNHIK
jgi:hypothetical protein